MADHLEKSTNQWINGELSDDEFRQQAGDDTLLKYQQIITEIDKWTPDNKPFEFSSESITSRGKVVSIYKWQYISVAAGIVLALFMGIWLLNMDTSSSFASNTGEIREIMLPDGKSKITLASNARVSWQESDWNDDQRTLTLEGKALFEVNPGSPFTVKTKSGNVSVLGTTFEVLSFGGSLSVSCFEGKVKASAALGETQIVNGGEAFLYHNGAWEENQPLENEQPLWLSNQTKFKNAPLTKVMETLRSEYDITIHTGTINLDRRYTGTIPNDNLQLALRLIFVPLHIQYELNEKELSLSE